MKKIPERRPRRTKRKGEPFRTTYYMKNLACLGVPYRDPPAQPCEVVLAPTLARWTRTVETSIPKPARVEAVGFPCCETGRFSQTPGGMCPRPAALGPESSASTPAGALPRGARLGDRRVVEEGKRWRATTIVLEELVRFVVLMLAQIRSGAATGASGRAGISTTRGNYRGPASC